MQHATRPGRPTWPECLFYRPLLGYATVLALTMPLLAQPCQRLELPGPEINTAAPASNGLGAKKVAVILFSFADHPLSRRSVTPAQVRERLITASDSTHAFLQEVSFGHLSLTGHLNPNGDVFGWYTIPVPANNNRDLANVVGTVLPLAQADGFDEANYDVVMFHHTVPSGWGGQAPFWNRVEIFNGFSSWVVAHEVLHILGIDHANGYRCTQGNVEVPVSHTCQSVGYGDPFDIQGNSGYRHPNAYFKARLGWFCTHNMTTVPSTPGRYVYALKPIENASSGLLGLRIPMPRQRVPLQFGFANPQDVDLFYYLEYRQPTAFDPFAAGDDVVHGVSIRINTDLNANHMALLVDTEPQTATFLDAPLTVGAAFGDAETGVTVRTLSTSPTEAVVEVTVNGCVDPTDHDCDDIPDVQDNCPDAPNADQTDRDSDAVGDVCDNCLRTPNTLQEDQDHDRVGDACDNCPATYNASQSDQDADGVGNVCDNCYTDANPDQEDSNRDGIGDACEYDTDGDGIWDILDNCPLTPNPEQFDSDGDGMGDVCDVCPRTHALRSGRFDMRFGLCVDVRLLIEMRFAPLAQLARDFGIDGPWEPYLDCPAACDGMSHEGFAAATRAAKAYLAGFEGKVFSRDDARKYLLSFGDMHKADVTRFIEGVYEDFRP